jgi:hypothetical protein
LVEEAGWRVLGIDPITKYNAVLLARIAHLANILNILG